MAQNKHILIVDDEVAILSVLKSSLKKLDGNYEIVTTTDGFAALELLQKQDFDIVVTDYQMAEMNGLELLEAIRIIQPHAKVIMMTAYGSNHIETEVRRLEAYEYLTKPLEIDNFRHIVMEALQEISVRKPGILVLSDTRYRRVMELLLQMQSDVGAHCVVLADANGRILVETESETNQALVEIVPLLGGGIATLAEVGRTLDGDAEATTLAFREGEREDIYVINLGQQILLIILITKGPYNSRLGSVWYYAQSTAETLRQIFGEADTETSKILLQGDMSDAIDAELDKLVLSDTPVAKTASSLTQSPPMPNLSEEQSKLLFSFDDALENGFVPEDLF